MKKLLISLGVLLLANLSMVAQDAALRGVPAVVLNAFQQQFPKARQVEWERKNDGNYEAEFNLSLIGRDHTVFISPEGKVLKHEEEISSSSLPDAVEQQIKTEFGGYRIEDAKQIDTGGIVTYRVDLEGRNNDLTVEFDPKGKILNERMD
ncbi:PepSY-like domain-containing protein [Parapedobacter sp. DT-150]|uniref:PepSY-like domain-containing protein n=1 Tax=Parapedobacter sp. DT-150 TaxID=3396162 RepID=UPI003F1B35A2